MVAAFALICSVAVSLPGMHLTPEPTGRIVGASYCQTVGKCTLNSASSMFYVFRGTVGRNQVERISLLRKRSSAPYPMFHGQSVQINSQ